MLPQVNLIVAKAESHCCGGKAKFRIIFLLYSGFPVLSVSAVPEIVLGCCQPLLWK